MSGKFWLTGLLAVGLIGVIFALFLLRDAGISTGVSIFRNQDTRSNVNAEIFPDRPGRADVAPHLSPTKPLPPPAGTTSLVPACPVPETNVTVQAGSFEQRVLNPLREKGARVSKADSATIRHAVQTTNITWLYHSHDDEMVIRLADGSYLHGSVSGNDIMGEATRLVDGGVPVEVVTE